MYNGIGLLTPRGSGTSGHVQSNAFNIYREQRQFQTRDDGKPIKQLTVRKPDEQILEHERKREIELKLVDLEDELETKGYTAEEIQIEVGNLRRELEADQANVTIEQHMDTLRERADTHALAKLKQAEMDKFASALQIEQREEGALEDSARAAARAQSKRDAEVEELEKRLLQEEEEEVARARDEKEKRRAEKQLRKAEKRAKEEARLAKEREAAAAAAAVAAAAEREAELERRKRATRRAQGYYAADDELPERFGEDRRARTPDRGCRGDNHRSQEREARDIERGGSGRHEHSAFASERGSRYGDGLGSQEGGDRDGAGRLHPPSMQRPVSPDRRLPLPPDRRLPPPPDRMRGERRERVSNDREEFKLRRDGRDGRRAGPAGSVRASRDSRDEQERPRDVRQGAPHGERGEREAARDRGYSRREVRARVGSSPERRRGDGLWSRPRHSRSPGGVPDEGGRARRHDSGREPSPERKRLRRVEETRGVASRRRSESLPPRDGRGPRQYSRPLSSSSRSSGSSGSSSSRSRLSSLSFGSSSSG